ncbi:MAG: hypothetical protein IAG10_20835 [Planctomycetaceae bacterium]|nr:hypothetical protein [Planctomycetaceae bacterium]
MPRQNRFRHQPYVAWESPPIPTTVAAVRSDQVANVDVGEILLRLRVRRVLLVHGTFVGNDPFGLAAKLDEMTDSAPPLLRPLVKTIAMEAWGRVLRGINQKLGDRVMGETGSFRDDYLNDFRALLRTDEIKVERFDWSSGNDHFTRAEAAVRLFNRLTDLPIDLANDRLLLWGHSHASNVFALLTNLLANDRDAVQNFFAAVGRIGKERTDWKTACERLAAAPSPHPLARALNLVTFGGPVRYGWDRDGYARLLHLVQQRPVAGQAAWSAKPALPQTLDEILKAKHGDWVQSFGIAGTDLRPVDREIREAHRALGQLFESGLTEPQVTGSHALLDRLPEAARARVREKFQEFLMLLERLRCGQRVPSDGDAAWLFDYGAAETEKFGHGVYMKRAWLPFHATRIAEWLRQTME